MAMLLSSFCLTRYNMFLKQVITLLYLYCPRTKTSKSILKEASFKSNRRPLFDLGYGNYSQTRRFTYQKTGSPVRYETPVIEHDPLHNKIWFLGIYSVCPPPA